VHDSENGDESSEESDDMEEDDNPILEGEIEEAQSPQLQRQPTHSAVLEQHQAVEPQAEHPPIDQTQVQQPQVEP
jgi:hypothetical protein